MIQIEKQSKMLEKALKKACKLAESRRDEFLMPEHLVWALAHQQEFRRAIHDLYIIEPLEHFLDKYSTTVPKGMEYNGPEPSKQMIDVANWAHEHMMASNGKEIDVPHIIQGIMMLDKSFVKYALAIAYDGDIAELMSHIIEEYGGDDLADLEDDEDWTDDEETMAEESEWMQYVDCLNESLEYRNPLIGREEEIERTIQVLCRKDKNNPLHVGEPGVGKTALAYGLAARIESGNVPERLKGCRVYSLDLGALMAGTQFRGDFEKRLKEVLEGLKEIGEDDDEDEAIEKSAAILYIDEIHNLIGAGRIEGGSLDAANLMKPYLEEGSLRFMGATTYEEFNRTISRSKGFARRFEKIDITEPTTEQCRLILHGLKKNYETFHNVVYTDEAIDYAVTASEKYITGRFLPDKAIDLIDEAGAEAECRVQSAEGRVQSAELPFHIIEKKDIAQVLSKICNVDTLAEDKDDIEQLEHLEQHIKSQIYGQDEAVKEVTEAVQMASAGLIDDDKPMASLLFVGPTGVGKTEVAKVLAKELSLPLVRFDMSEYAEKHTVAKLIGSPAGYVGYDDGGLLTDAIRKTPHCVLLFDELEKAHQDIYNILLQVMDYAVLTDNKGQKADFRHVIFIMTTNAGAQYARQAALGFNKTVTAGEAMMKSVKKTFKPEFLNRLTGINIFHDMNRSMAELILDKKLNQLNERLSAKKVTMTLSDPARDLLLKHGFSEEYGGREIDRVINTELKPLLMRALLFGSLKNGGEAIIDTANDALILRN